jgi:RHS repeat-associated protein
MWYTLDCLAAARTGFLHVDHLGSTSLTTDQSGAPVAETRYLPYGEERWITSTLVTDFTFTGQRADSYIQLMEMGARWYDPQIGRWISLDSIISSIGDPQALDRYAYTYNNSLRYMDPSGHYIFEESPHRDDLHAFYPPGWAAPGREPFVRDVAIVCDTIHFAHEPTTREMVIAVGAPFAGAAAMATASVATSEEASRFALNEGLAVAGYTGGVMAIICNI